MTVTIMKKRKIKKLGWECFKNMGGNIPGGNFLDGDFPGGNFPRGSLMGGNFPGGSFPDTDKSDLHFVVQSHKLLV